MRPETARTAPTGGQAWRGAPTRARDAPCAAARRRRWETRGRRLGGGAATRGRHGAPASGTRSRATAGSSRPFSRTRALAWRPCSRTGSSSVAAPSQRWPFNRASTPASNASSRASATTAPSSTAPAASVDEPAATGHDRRHSRRRDGRRRGDRAEPEAGGEREQDDVTRVLARDLEPGVRRRLATSHPHLLPQRRQALLADPRHLAELLDGAEAAVLLAVLEDRRPPSPGRCRRARRAARRSRC